MSGTGHDLTVLALTFVVLSLLAVGGALSALPDMHRIAVETQHWMSDREFTEAVALAQISPGPNILVVTLIGYHVAGAAGAIVSTLAMCGPSAALAYTVDRIMQHSRKRTWPGVIRTALVPVAIGMTGASVALLGYSVDKTWTAVAVTLIAAVLSLVTRINPLLLLGAGALLGFAGVM